MKTGLRLRSTAADLATLDLLLRRAPGLADGAWWSAATADGAVIGAEGLAEAAGFLSAVGADIGTWAKGLFTGADEPVPTAAPRAAAHLLEAIPPRRSIHESIPAECLLVTPADRPSAARLVERLLRLGRGDVRLAEWIDAEAPRLVAHLVDPPLYVLLRARDGDEPVAAYARHREGPLWVEWGVEHPLADIAAAHLQAAGAGALVDRSGRWWTVPARFEGRPAHDLVEARFGAPARRLDPTEGEPRRFAVQLRLEADRWRPPTLWILDVAEFAALESMVEQARPAVLSQVSVARLSGLSGVRYVLRLRASGGAGTDRLAGLLDRPGFTRLPGAERVFVPAGQRLGPPLPLETVRAALGLGAEGLVVVRAGEAGTEAVHVAAVPEAPLSRYVDYLALDNRRVLDALLEEAVFEVPALHLDRPVVRAARVRPPKPRPHKPRRAVEPVEAAPRAAPRTEAEQARVARAEAAPLEAAVVAGGCTDPQVWGRLGDLLEILQQPDDAAACHVAAAFYAADPEARADRIAAVECLRRPAVAVAVVPRDGLAEAMLEVATADAAAPAQVGWLGAAAAATAWLSADQLMDGLAAALNQQFARPQAPCGRRLAWLVLHAIHARTGDALGLTRAKEVLLGALNTDGLREGYDAPRFVRLGLALGGGGEVADDAVAARGTLGVIWDRFGADLELLEVQPSLYRAIFAVGFAKAGDMQRARELAELVQEELPVYDPPVRALLRLYLAQLEAIGAEEPEAARRGAIVRLERSLEPGTRRTLAFARRRSGWLSDEEAPAPPVHGSVQKVLARIPQPHRAAEALTAVGQLRDALEYQVAAAGQVCLRAALSTGRDEIIAATVSVAARLLATLRIPGERASLAGAIIAAAAILGDEARVAKTLARIISLLADTDSVLVLLRAVVPAMAALRRVGLSAEAARFSAALTEVARRDHRDAAKMAIFAADGYRLLGDLDAATDVLQLAEGRIYADGLDNVARFEAAGLLFDTLRAWPAPLREARALAALERLAMFRDSFTTRRYFELHKVLLVERVVDALSDARSFASGRLRLWLEAEEQAVRRRIVDDWRELAR